MSLHPGYKGGEFFKSESEISPPLIEETKLELDTMSGSQGDVSDSWNPMDFQVNSLQNLNCADAHHAALGLTNIRGSLCPHADSSGGCYKGFRCPHRYHIDQKKIAQNPKMAIPLATTPVTHLNKLPNQPIGTAGMIFEGSVTYVSSPSEFFIVPDNGFTCYCKNIEEMTCDPLTTMINEMDIYYGRHQFKNAVSFVAYELLTVKYTFRRKNSYFRAVVLEEVVLETDQPPDVKCFFMDLGKTVFVNLFDVAPLPKIFCHQPPLAYKCSLYGISPVYSSYSSQVIRLFQKVINWKTAIFIIRRPCNPNQEACRVLPWQSRPIELEMRVNLDDKNPFKYTDVRDKLFEAGALKWNSNINRPLPWKEFTDTQIDILVCPHKPKVIAAESTSKEKKYDSEKRALRKYMSYADEESQLQRDLELKPKLPDSGMGRSRNALSHLHSG